MGHSVFAVLLAYLLGSISFAVLVSAVMGLKDPRTYGSGNPGATNVLRTGNRLAALLTLLGDALKGWLAVFLARHFSDSYFFGDGTIAAVALAAFLGHLYPIYHRFKGGKGVATAAGILFALDWRLGLAVLAVWIVVAFISRYSSLAAVLAAVAAPLIYMSLKPIDLVWWAILAMSTMLVIRHRENIGRLLTGKESKLGQRKATEAKTTEPQSKRD